MKVIPSAHKLMLKKKFIAEPIIFGSDIIKSHLGKRLIVKY